jgi:hypothetical protein
MFSCLGEEPFEGASVVSSGIYAVVLFQIRHEDHRLDTDLDVLEDQKVDAFGIDTINLDMVVCQSNSYQSRIRLVVIYLCRSKLHVARLCIEIGLFQFSHLSPLHLVVLDESAHQREQKLSSFIDTGCSHNSSLDEDVFVGAFPADEL